MLIAASSNFDRERHSYDRGRIPNGRQDLVNTDFRSWPDECLTRRLWSPRDDRRRALRSAQCILDPLLFLVLHSGWWTIPAVVHRARNLPPRYALLFLTNRFRVLLLGTVSPSRSPSPRAAPLAAFGLRKIIAKINIASQAKMYGREPSITLHD